MADVKISQLPAATSVDGSEDLPGLQSGTTKKVKTRDIAKLGYQDIVSISASRDFALTDVGAWLRTTSGTALTCTVPPNSSAAFPVGISINGVQGGAGKLTIAAGAGVAINNPDGYTSGLRAQGSSFCLIKIATDTWDLIGDLGAV